MVFACMVKNYSVQIFKNFLKNGGLLRASKVPFLTSLHISFFFKELSEKDGKIFLA